ncbi:hypothetical protein CPB84DRAFT_1710693 [Gymnopilus junonius]|uniref:Protein kinase domain-containing protein n=1 Tax=Gymnopilus junonius TaxID=109634 RepID=A0A9P5NKA5_GYMJU|nr:hypothetical protein CPB84DRAFT_1710693 [Gymnopilus junonius]
MDNNLRPDYGIKSLDKANPWLTEVIPNPTSTDVTSDAKLQAEEAVVVDESSSAKQTKTRRDFLEELIISTAPEEVRNKDKLTSTSTRDEVAAYRERVLNDKQTRHRFVFQRWSRDPNGAPIKPDNSKLGKMTPNNVQIWGATLFDFYTVNRIPSVPNLVTFSSGSKLARWMKEQKETYAQDFVERQDEEEDPRLIFPCDIGRLIKDGEAIFAERSWATVDGKGKEKEQKPWELPELWPPASPFHPSAYPHPWPRQPFANDFRTRVPTLQQYIMQSLLPKKLVVHDPWKVLSVRYTSEDELEQQQQVPWNEKRDITHVYNLRNSTQNTKRKETDDAEAMANQEKRKRILEVFLADPHSKNEFPGGYMVSQSDDKPGPCIPPVYVVLPFLPNREPMEEAHLYIAPVSKIGEGNHSHVYRAELELPRNHVVDEEICHQCVLEDMCEIIREQDGENNERRDPKWDVKNGKYFVKTIQKPEVVTTMMNKETGKEETYILKNGMYSQELVYEGPFRIIESRIQYQDLSKGPYCKHLQAYRIHPLTSKVGVTAKLSFQGDNHLAREAENYQAFPRHFFEHWSGYNIINPLHDPTPVGPVVPQFYGYYVVDQKEEKKLREEREADRKRKEDRKGAEQEGQQQEPQMDLDKDHQSKTSSQISMEAELENDKEEEEEEEEEGSNLYLSPILLLENCGTPIEPSDLSIDDKSESASLAYRFHEEGWVHGSLARRNILRQPGPLSAWPIERMVNMSMRGGIGEDWSFRLIDFGRSYKLREEDLGHPSKALIEEGSTITAWVQGWGAEIN